MLRQQVLRSWRPVPLRLSGAHASRSFTAGVQRRAEVELTIGVYLVVYQSGYVTRRLTRLQMARRYRSKVSQAGDLLMGVLVTNAWAQ